MLQSFICVKVDPLPKVLLSYITAYQASQYLLLLHQAQPCPMQHRFTTLVGIDLGFESEIISDHLPLQQHRTSVALYLLPERLNHCGWHFFMALLEILDIDMR